MRAIRKAGSNLSFCTVPKPDLKDDEVLIKVITAGICRTDISVMKGVLGKSQVIPGHEFSGYIELGNSTFQKGDVVAVNPIQNCRKCEQCKSGLAQLCQNSRMLGLDHNGVFAEFVAVRSDLVYKLPENISLKAAAFLEPIAANLAVFNAGLKRSDLGGIVGDNRIANLMIKILRHKEYVNVDWPVNRTRQYDYIIETSADNETIGLAIERLKPRGKLIIKSRSFQPTGMVFSKLVAKELRCIAVNYGTYEEAISLLGEGLDIEELFGKTFRLDQYEEAIEEAIDQETRKVFLCAEL